MNNSNDWFTDFFQGAALKVWRSAISDQSTQHELDFLYEVLAVPEHSEILDLPCGNGRLALPMASSGYKITGIDSSKVFIDEAKNKAGSALSNAVWVQEDIRKINFSNKFDGAFCMGNSFGYFDLQGSLTFLKAVSASLKPGAKFVLDTLMAAETFLVNGGEREWVQVNDIYMLIENSYDCRQSCVKTAYTFIENGVAETRHSVHWIYTVGEICRLLELAGLSVENIYGSLDFDPYDLGSERLLLVAEKV